MQTKPNLPKVRRPAFNLVELLVVIAIFGILVSLSGGTYMLVIKSQRERNTEILIQKLTQALQGQQSVFISQMRKKEVPHQYLERTRGDRFKAYKLWVNDELPYEFPGNFQDASFKYRQWLPNPIPSPSPTESSECLLMALSFSRGGQEFKPETALEASAMVDLEGNNMKEIRDAWGDPISFHWERDPVKDELRPVIKSSHIP